MKIQRLYYFITLVVCLASSYYSFAQKDSLANERLIEIYSEAVKDASRDLTSKDIYTNLISLKYGASTYTQWNISDKDTMLLVATYQRRDWAPIKTMQDSIFFSSDNMDRLIWIFIPRELEERLSDFDNTDSHSSSIRLCQMLGLPPVDKYSVIYYLWVNKNNLLRPSFDTDVTSSDSYISFPKNTSTEYKDWFTSFVSDSYNDPLPLKRYPFTRLGYTYDWCPSTSKYGLSEFVVKPNSAVRLAKKISIADGEWW